MDGHLKHSRRSSLDSAASPRTPTQSIATGTALRTREHARRELQQASNRDDAANPSTREESGTDMAAYDGKRLRFSADTVSGDERNIYLSTFEQSSMYVDEDELLELRRRPPVAFVVRNGASKEEEVQSAVATTIAGKEATKRGQSWNSLVHVPLAHRKLVQPPEIFRQDPPFRPIAPRAPTVKSRRKRDSNRVGKTIQKPTKLTPMPDSTLEFRDQLSNRAFVERLREKNKVLFDRLAKRYATLRRASCLTQTTVTADNNNYPADTKFSGVEDAILFFLDAKHKHDVLYFARKNGRGAKSAESAKMSLGFSSAPTTTGKYMPYDLERIDEAPRSGTGDYFMMTSTSLVHHSNNNDNDVSGEVIPLSQWIMESKMFSLLLAGIPLFQKFLVRKVFVGWVRAIRLTIYRDNCKYIAQCLPFARASFVRPMLHSCRVLRDIQEIRSLTLPSTRPAVDLVDVQEHLKDQLTATEMKLIDAKEKLLGLMEEMVQQITDDLQPQTNLDELYSAEVASVRTINVKWKSAPIAAMHQRNSDLQRQRDTAALDMSLLETFIRMISYMFTESLYLMIIGGVEHLSGELSAEGNLGALCAAVTIAGDSLELSPSLKQTKHVFLDGLARLIRLVSNFHFTKNAITWSNNRGTGVLAFVAESFESNDMFSAEFELQSVLRKDPTFDVVTKELSMELAQWFDLAAQQMLAFESLRLIYLEIRSVRKCSSSGEGCQDVQVYGNNLLYSTTNISRLIGIPSSEVSRFLKNITHHLNMLDRSQHACQKLQSSWKVGFLEIQCRRSISEILELIANERNSLHQNLFRLAIDGVTECVGALQRATLMLEDRPQLIEFFCEQMKQVRLLKEGEKQLNQNIRNVDDTVRALKHFAPPLGSEVSPQYNVMHQLLGKYTALVQSHAKFAAKVLPNITYQVNTALQKYSLRCQKLLRMYDEFSDMEEEEDMEKNVGIFQEVVRELASIEKATKLYQEYQKMVGMKVVEIPSLAEAMTKWGEVQELVTFTLQWLTAINSMENGIFSEQNWAAHAEKVHGFLPVIRELQSRERVGFAEKMLGNIHQAVIDYLRKLSLVKEMAQPWVKVNHWKEILKLMDILNYVSNIGVLITDGFTVTLGFLRSRDLWKYELQIREITQKAHDDAVTEKKLNAMKARLHDAMLPIIRIQDSYELDLIRASQLLESFEDDLLTIQSLAQVTASGSLQLQLVQWREEVRHCEEVLDKWSAVQRGRTKLSLLFSLEDVQQSVTEASFEFQAIDRKWRGMMHTAKGTSSLSICLREVVTIGFLTGAQESYAKLWLQLGSYLDEKRKYFPRFNFLSDHDLFQFLMIARDSKHIPRMISKCFGGINSLRLVPTRMTTASTELVNFVPTSLDNNANGASTEENVGKDLAKHEDDLAFTRSGVDIDAVYGAASGEVLPIKPLRVSANPQIWMKELDENVQSAMVEAVSSLMDGTLFTLFEDNLEPLIKPRSSALKERVASRSDNGERIASVSGDNPLVEIDARIAAVDDREWKDYPLQVVILCVHILVTHELTPLVRLDRTGAAWQRFWHLFQLKKNNLIEYIMHRMSSPRERWIASSILTLLLNKSHGIRELYEDQPLTIVSQSVGAATMHQTDSDVSVYHYGYAAGDSFTWTKLPRFYYDPFERRCTIHHLVKTFQYEYSFIGSYSVPVLSPLCERTVLAMSTALSLEHGLLVHSPNGGGCTRKRTLVRDLSAMVGRECIEFDYSNGLTLTHFKRILRGVLQSNSMWLLFSGLEVSNMLRVFVQEMNQIVDSLRAHQDSIVLASVPVDITNNELVIVVTCSLDYQLPHHQHVFLELSSSFAPISCPSVSPELLVEALLLVNGFKDWKQLSQKLEALFCQLIDDPVPFTKNLSISRLPLAFAIVRNISHRLDTNPWQSSEKSLVAAIWDEVRTKVLPERRVAFLKCIRAIFPHAIDLEINAFGMLALRAPMTNATSLSSANAHENPTISEDATLSYDSDEEDGHHELKAVKMKIETAIIARKMSVSESYIRKLLELYQIVAARVIVVVAGRGVCGKSTAISVLSAVIAGELAASDTGKHPMNDFQDEAALNKSLRTVRLYPEAFTLKNIYGEAISDSLWDDGFFCHFFRQNCVDAASNDNNFGYMLEHPTNPDVNSSTRRRSFLATQTNIATATASNRSLAPASWIVFDGVRDAPTLLEPLRGLMESSPKDMKKMCLPNGDQLECTQKSLRIFCEVESLQQWSPACLNRCGLVYMQAEHMVPYTLLIKSWMHKQQTSRRRSTIAHLTQLIEPTSEYVAKLMRTHLPPLLEVFKRYSPPFLECSITHAVSNMLQLLTPFVAEITKGVVDDDTEWMVDARIIVAYTATMSLGMILPPRARMEFHHAAIKIAPQLLEEHPIFTLDSSATLFDIGLRFQDHRVVLFLWSRSLVEFSKPAARRSSFAYQSEFPRRTSAVLKARGRIVTSEDTDDGEGDEEFLGDTSTITSPVSIIYVPTAVTVSCSAWLKMIGLAKANAFVVGESGIGKTLVMENCLRELGQKERVSAAALQINSSTTGFDIQRAIENGMTGKLKGAYCPGVGKRGLVLLLENLNLDTQDSSMQANGPCSAMIRQVIDGKGSFLKSTKEYVQFRDLAVWCSFSMSPLGYPRVPSRLLRHFHMILLPEQSDQVFTQVVPVFTAYFRRRYQGLFGNMIGVVHRLIQFPIQMFKRTKKMWRPSAVAPHLLLNLGSVLSVFISLMNISLSRVPVDSATEFELMTLYFTMQLHRNLFLEQTDQDQLQSSALRIAKKLGFSSQSLGYFRSSEEFFFADCGDTEGITRINAKALTAMFISGEERFHWYHKTTLKANPASDISASGPESSISGEQSTRSPRKGTRSVSHLLSATADGIESNLTSFPHEAMIIRRSSLAMVALKTGLPNEKVTTAPSIHQLQNMLDVYSFLQSGVRHLLFSGSDTADRRSTTMVACGTLSFQFREVSTELRLGVFIENVKAIVLDAGLKATQTVLYAEFEDLNPEEVALLVYLIRQDDLPPHVYSSADKVKLHAIDHQPKGLPTAPPPATKTSFLQEVTSPEKDKKSGAKRTASSSLVHLLTIFRENVRRSLYIVVSIGCKDKLLEFMTCQPSVYYRFVLKTFPRWQDVSADAVCNSTLHEWTPLNDVAVVSKTTCSLPGGTSRFVVDAGALRDMMIILHRTAENFVNDDSYRLRKFLPSPAMRGRRFGAVTTQLDDMLRVFKVLFAFQHKKLERQQRDLEKALQFLSKRLSQTNVRVAKEETSEVLQSDASQAVMNTTAQLAAQEAIEREARRLFLLDEEQCAKIQSEIEVERANIQRELSKTLPDVQEATEALSQINKYHIVEMKSFTNPPQLVRLAMQAVCVLLDVPPTWSEALRILADIHFLDRLRFFDKDSIDPSLMDRVKFYVNHPDFSMENMRRASLASTTLCKWVLALVRYFEAMKRVAPTQKLLEETEKNYHIMEERAQTEKGKLMDIEIHLAGLRSLHTRNLQREAELQRTQETRLRWKSSVASFGHVIKQWYDITRERLESVEQQRVNLLGNCALVSTLIVFGAENPYEDREKLVFQCREAIQRHFTSPPKDLYPVAFNIPTLLQHWVLSGEGLATHLRKVIVDMQDEEDEAFASSLFLMDQAQQMCFKIPLLVDPLDRGVAWLKLAYRNSVSCTTPSKGSTRNEGNRSVGDSKRDEPGTIVVVDAGDPLLLRSIETCLVQSPPSMVLVENASEGDEATIEAALELILLLKEKSTCAVYFTTKSLNNAASWTPKTWSRFAVVDFTPTRRDLDNHFLAMFCHNSTVAVQSDIESFRAKLSIEKAKEETLFKSFLVNLCEASDEAAKASNAGLSLTAASILTAWISPGTGQQGFYNEESMERISLQLNNFISVRQTRKQLQQDLENLYNERRRAIPFARRARAFVLAEEGMSRLRLSLHLSLSQTSANISECLEQSLLKSQQTSEDGNTTSEMQSLVQQENLEQKWNTKVSTLTVLTTISYVCQRLAGFPTSLHRTYILSLVLSIGEIDDEEDRTLGIPHHVLTEGVRERILRMCSGRSMTCHDGDRPNSNDMSNVAKQTARIFVDQVIEAALAATWGDLKSRTHLNDELLTAFLKIQNGFLRCTSGKTTTNAIKRALYRDMVENVNDWKAYMKSASAFEAPVEQSSSIRSNRNTKTYSAKSIPWPVWVKQNFRLLGRLQIHVSLFDSIPLQMIDDLIATHLGEQEMLSLLGISEQGGGIVRPSLDTLVEKASFLSPLLVLSDSSELAVASSSSVRSCARQCGIPAEAVAFMPADHATTRCAGSTWSYRDKTATNMVNNDSVVRHVAAVSRLKEISMDPGWTIIEGAAASSLSIMNAVRLQIVRLGDVKSTNHDFRLWLVEDIFSRRHDLSNVPGRRLFLEPPQTLRQHYNAFLLAEQERRETEKLKNKREKAQQNDEMPSRPPPLTRHASSVLTAVQRSNVEQQHIRAALWLFHSIFRLHLQNSRGAATIPTDLFISHNEHDRVTRLIQLHLHQRAVATTVMSRRSSLIQSSTPSAAAASEAHGKTLTELAALVYMGRLGGDCRVSQCRELLTSCFHYDTLDLHSADQEASMVSRILQLRERLVTTTMTPCTKLFEKVELSLLPISVQHHQRAYESASLLKNLATMYGPSSSEDTSATKSVITVASLLPCALQRLEELMAAFPSKTSLSGSVKQLQKQQRESMIIGWGKRTSSSVEALVTEKQNTIRHPPSRQGRTSTYRRQQYALTHLQQQPTAHVIQVELPAMESYLTFIWTNAEMFLSLRPDSMELLNPDVMTAIEALARGDLPPTWRGDAMRSDNYEGYSTPTRLKPWLRWFQQSVAFFHTHQQCVMALAPIRIDSIWLPALQRPKALLYSFRHSISVSTRLHLSKISLMVLPHRSKTQPSDSPAEDVLGSIVLSGLFLSNANWSVDSGTLSEQVPGWSLPTPKGPPSTPPGRSQALPPLTVHATTRFRCAPEGLMLPSTSAVGPLPSQTAPNLECYRCPIYQSPDDLAALKTPLEYVFLPVSVEQHAGIMAVLAAALFLLDVD